MKLKVNDLNIIILNNTVATEASLRYSLGEGIYIDHWLAIVHGHTIQNNIWKSLDVDIHENHVRSKGAMGKLAPNIGLGSELEHVISSRGQL